MLAVMEARLNRLDLSGQDQERKGEIRSDLAKDEDIALMERVKAGDSEAFNLLMKKYEKTVVNLVFRFTGDRESAEDLAQEVFLRVYRAAGRFEARAKFFTYLYKVTLNLCRNARAKAQRRRTNSLDAPRPGYEDQPLKRELEDPAGSAEDHLARQELAEVVREAVMDLPEEQRVAVILQRYQGLAYEEIADTLGLSIPAVKSRLHRAKLNLRKKLEPYLENEEITA